MAKRRAEKQLNKDEVELDDEEEESGEFTKADSNTLANRVIKTAKRRSASTVSDGPNPLANFAGFSATPKSSPSIFFTKSQDNPKSEASSQVNNNESAGKPSNLENLKALNLCCSNWIQQHLEKNPYVVLLPVFKDYEKHLATLNLNLISANDDNSIISNNKSAAAVPFSFVANPSSSSIAKSESIPSAAVGLKQSDTSRPSIKLESTLEKKSFEPSKEEPSLKSSAPAAKSFNFGMPPSTTVASLSKPIVTETTKTNTFTPPTTSNSTKPQPAFSFGLNNVIKSSSDSPSGGFSFGVKQSDKTDGQAAAPAFAFGLKNGSTTTNTSTSGGFFFGSKVEPPKAEETATISTEVAASDANNDEDEPPKSEFVPVGEEGSIFDIRCKMFVKKEGQYDSVGVGTLFLKPVAGGKTQVIIRADTSQGSVLMNLILTPDLPLQKTGKNNVLIVCIPTPDAKPPPVPVLIRVKSEEERDRLFSKMETLQSGS